MKKKIVSTLLCTAMLVTMMAGCGGNNAGDEDRRQTKEAGMSEHLAKPIDPKLLYTTLQKFILP